MTKVEEIIIKEGSYSKEVHKMIKLTPKQKADFVKDMEKFSNGFLSQHFGLSLTVPIEIDGRLTRAGGSFHSRRDGTAVKIKMSERFIACALYDEEGIDGILSVLRHELVHFALCELGEDYRDGSETFESKLAELNIASSGATNKKKIKTEAKNIWYTIYDLYSCPITKKQYTMTHTQKEQQWSGKRTGFKLVKLYF